MHNSTHMCPMTRVMPLGLVKHTILKRFNKWNPDVDPEYLDWDNLDYTCNFGENYDNMANAHPQYVWDEEDTLDIIEQKEKEIEIQKLIDKGVDEATIDRIRDEMEMQNLKGGWKKGWVAGKETYIKTVEIKLHCNRGRVQALCDPELIGLEAKITIVKPDKSET